MSTLSLSRALAAMLLDSAPFNAGMADCFLDVYGGTIPVNADPTLPNAEAALGSATLLCTYTDNGGAGGLDWEAAATDNVLSKDTTQVWKGTCVATGSATFFRFYLAGDDGSASITAKRMQGVVGTANGDLLLTSLAFVLGEDYTINSYLVAQLS